MFEDPDLNRFVYILIGAAVLMAALWYFVIAPIERRNHERKMANLQEKIRNHQEKTGAKTKESDPAANSGG